MKRILSQVFIFIAGLLFLGASAPKLSMEAMFHEFDYEVSFYSLTKSKEDLETVNAGNFYIITAPKEKEKELEIKLNGIVGKSYRFKNNNFDSDKFISENGLEIKITQDLENSKVLYLYSDKLNGGKTVNGEKINLQIVVTDDAIIAASPVILGSY